MTVKWFRYIAAAALLAAAATALFFYFSPDEGGAECAFNHFVAGELDHAQSALESARLSPARTHLYLAYIAQARGELDLAESLLEGALEQSGCEKEIECEIHLTLALNDLMAKEGGWWLQSQPLPPALRAEAAYLAHDMAAVESALMDQASSDLPAWLSHAIDLYFNQTWRALRLAECEIARAEITSARERLDRLSREDLSIDNRQLRSALLAVCLAHRAKQSGSLEGYTIARERLADLPTEVVAAHSEQLSYQWKEAALHCFHHQQWEEWELFCGDLERWQAYSVLDCIATEVADELLAVGSRIDWRDAAKQAHALQSTSEPHQIGERIGQHLEEELAGAIERGRVDNLFEMWRLAQLFAAQPTALNERCSNHIVNQVLEIVGEELTTATALIGFWKSLPHTSAERIAFSQQLLARAHYTWRDQIERGAEAMRLAYSIPTQEERLALVDELDLILRAAFEVAKEGDEVGQMVALDGLAQEFSIELIDDEARSMAGNLLADATYYYRSGRFAEANERAAWMVRLEPDHAEALHLLALSHFELGNHKIALEILQSMSDRGDEVEELIGISLLRMGQFEEGFVHMRALKAPLSERAHIEMASALISAGQSDEAIEWAAGAGQRAAFFTLYARLQRGDQEGIARAFEELEPSDQKRGDLNCLLANVYLSYGQIGRAKEALERAMVGPYLLPAPDPRAVSGRLALQLDEGPQSALACVAGVENCDSYRLRAEIAELDGDLIGAFAHLRKATRMAGLGGSYQQVCAEAARIGRAAGLLEDVDQITDSPLHREMGRFEQRLAQLGDGQTVEEKMERTALLVELGRWDESLEVAEQLLTKELPPKEQLQIAAAARALEGRLPTVDALLATLADSELTLDQLRLALLRGDRERCERLLAHVKEGYEKDLARVELATDAAERGQLVEKLLACDPALHRRLAYVELPQEVRSRLTAAARKRWQERREMISAQLAYCRFALLWDQPNDEACELIRKVGEQLEESAELQTLVGRACKLEGKREEAHQHFARAAHLSPGHAIAQKELAQSWSCLGEQRRAIEALRTALRYSPLDSSLWSALGDLYTSTNQPKKAAQCRERAEG